MIVGTDVVTLLVEHRQRLGLTQAQIAHILDVDPVTVSRWERRINKPNLRDTRRIRDICGARFDFVDKRYIHHVRVMPYPRFLAVGTSLYMVAVSEGSLRVDPGLKLVVGTDARLYFVGLLNRMLQDSAFVKEVSDGHIATVTIVEDCSYRVPGSIYFSGVREGKDYTLLSFTPLQGTFLVDGIWQEVPDTRPDEVTIVRMDDITY